MKKIILILFLFLTAIKVDALEYGVWTDEVSSDENSKVIASEKRYRWYKDNTVLSPDYYIEGENDPQYPFVLPDDYIYTEWSEWQDTTLETKLNRSVEYVVANRYRTLRPIRYLFITDFTSYININKISEMNVLINEVEIPINVTCTNCTLSFDEEVTDGDFQGDSFIRDSGIITIDLGDYFNINEIGLEMFVYSDTADSKTFNVYYNEGSTIADRNYAKKHVYLGVDKTRSYEADRFYVIPDAASITNPIYNDWIYIDGFVNATYYRQMQVVTLSRYRDTKYQHYRMDRSYLDGYYSYLEDSSYVKDEESAKTYYLYEYVISSSEDTDGQPEVEDNEPVIDDEHDSFVIDNSSSEGDSVTSYPQLSVNDQQVENSSELGNSSNQSGKDKTNFSNIKNTSEYLNEQSISITNESDNIDADDKDDFLKLNKTITSKKKSNSENIIYKLLNNFIKYISSKMLIIFTILIFLTIIVLFKFRHHILSHQN
jgi:hypothetical protein